MNARCLAVLLLLSLLVGNAFGEVPSPQPQWIWISEVRKPDEFICFRHSFDVRKNIQRAELIAVADYCRAVFYVNGRRVDGSEPFARGPSTDITDFLNEGNNTLGVCCQSVNGPAAMMARVELRYADGQRQTIVTSQSWQSAALDKPKSLRWPASDERVNWRAAKSLGNVVPHLWGLEEDTIAINPADDYTQWKRAVNADLGTDPKTFQVVDGFEVELLHSAAKDEGSWVSLVGDPLGRWIIGIEKKGLLRLALPSSPQESAKVERINDTLRECRGLAVAHNALYAMANGDKALFRLRDTNNDDQFDKVEKIAELLGDAGHGRNQLTIGPKGQVWGIFGDSVFEPVMASKLPTTLAAPNDSEKTRSGFVVRFGEDASQMEVVVRGLRNPYGLDFNRHGEMFTYDADAEYDMGSSWYRPTRVNQLLPGGDYGWRRVTRQWPPYFSDRPDTPQPTYDVGKGSPTAVEFCAGDNFPHRYRDALFALDWAYGRILAVHLTPRGSSYSASAETFLRGAPLNVTDVEFGNDGAMYFVTGGRGTQSALYRVKYVGAQTDPSKPTIQQLARRGHAEDARAVRRSLTDFRSAADSPAIDQIWPRLNSNDPWIRFAARTALERHGAAEWRRRAMEERDSSAASAARIALLRVDPLESTVPIAKLLPGLDFGRYPPMLQLEVLYQYARCLAGAIDLPADVREQMFRTLASYYPASTRVVKRDLSLLLSKNADENFVTKTMRLLDDTRDQAKRLHYLFVLRSVPTGWTPGLRRRYFEQLREMNDYVGGEGMPTFRKLIQREAVAAVPKTDRPEFTKILETGIEKWRDELVEAKTQFVRKWTVDEVAAAWANSKSAGDPARGKRIFASARCILCHRCGGPGGVSGPDLTSLARRFSARDALTAIIEPSRVISEKYALSTFELKSGRAVTGRIAAGDYRLPYLEIVPDVGYPDKTIRIEKADIVRRTPSAVSAMPSGLLDTLDQQECLDLLAFLMRDE